MTFLKMCSSKLCIRNPDVDLVLGIFGNSKVQKF